jgi:hypothetical protein
VLTGDEKPLMEDTMIVTLPFPPWGRAIEPDEDESEKLG